MAVTAKICGLSTPDTLSAAISAGASHVGFVHFPKSPRHLDIERAAALRDMVPAGTGSVLLLVNPETALLDAAIGRIRPDIVQLHGNEQPEQIAQWKAQFPATRWWKAIPVKTTADVNLAARFAGLADRVLYDAKPPAGAALPGGNGLRFDWTVLQGVQHPLPWALCGGLDVGNVAEAIRITHAPMVDLSSGVESAPGVKDINKIHDLLQAVRQL
jgi:phosphoribosylanthranilate isomerase